MSTASLDPLALRRARLLLALAALPPLHCADCGKQVSLPFAVVARRAGVYVDLCPSCAAREQADTRYQHVTCPKCRGQYQRIDYRSALHLLTCDPIPEPVALAARGRA